MKKIGILGGSFNPIHNAHLMMAYTAKKQFELDDMWLIPAKNPPHKQSVAFSDEHRLNMLRLAIREYPGLSVHLYEYGKDGLSYTVETLRAFHRCYPDCHFFYVMGEDSLADFKRWYHPEEIAQLADIIVASRDFSNDSLRKLLIENRAEFGNPFLELEMDYLPISSTEIRCRVRNGEALNGLVPKSIEQYISDNGLYKENV